MNITGELSYKLEGNINISYNDKLYNLSKANFYVLVTEGDIVVAIKLIAKFLEASIGKLSNYIDGLKAYKDGYYSYSFILKEQVLEKNRDKFSDALSLEEILKVDEGACLKLENYNFQGYAEA